MDDSSRPATGYPIHPTRPPNGHAPPSGTAYAYQAPPPTQPTYPNYYYNNQAPQPFYPSPRALFLRRLIGAFIVITVLIFVIFFISWLILRPRLPEFQVTQFSLSNFNVSSSTQRVTGDWATRFRVYNPNKKIRIDYNVLVCSIAYKSEFLSETRIPPFRQGPKNETAVDATVSVSNAYIDGWAASDIAGDRGRGTVAFDVKVEADADFEVGTLRARRRVIRVLCGNVAVGISGGSGNLTGGVKQCRVYAFCVQSFLFVENVLLCHMESHLLAVGSCFSLLSLFSAKGII